MFNPFSLLYADSWFMRFLDIFGWAVTVTIVLYVILLLILLKQERTQQRSHEELPHQHLYR
jgi:hypothetical protein